jgi:hypothetical protein
MSVIFTLMPDRLAWRIEDGYLRVVSWGVQTDPHTLGIWGPGDLVIPALIDVAPLELLSLSGVHVQEELPTPDAAQPGAPC